MSQVPRVISGSFADNICLGHAERPLASAIEVAQLGPDVTTAGGVDAAIGNKGVRLSGGQVQRLALARALATGSELLVADDISSALDAATELKVWQALRGSGQTVIGSTSKAAALEMADAVIVLEKGRVAAIGTWRDLAPKWHHLAG